MGMANNRVSGRETWVDFDCGPALVYCGLVLSSEEKDKCPSPMWQRIAIVHSDGLRRGVKCVMQRGSRIIAQALIEYLKLGERKCRIAWAKVRIDFDRSTKLNLSFNDICTAEPPQMPQPAQIVVPSMETARQFYSGAFLLGTTNFGF